MQPLSHLIPFSRPVKVKGGMRRAEVGCCRSIRGTNLLKRAFEARGVDAVLPCPATHSAPLLSLHGALTSFRHLLECRHGMVINRAIARERVDGPRGTAGEAINEVYTSALDGERQAYAIQVGSQVIENCATVTSLQAAAETHRHH